MRAGLTTVKNKNIPSFITSIKTSEVKRSPLFFNYGKMLIVIKCIIPQTVFCVAGDFDRFGRCFFLNELFTYMIVLLLLFTLIILVAYFIAYTYKKRKNLKKLSDWFDAIAGNGDGTEFEKFLEVFFTQSGWKVEKPAGKTNTADFGVDFVLDGKIAVQAKNYANGVTNKAIQEVFAGMKYWKSNGFPHLKYAIVISTSDFTRAAKKQAYSVGVVLKDGNDIRNVLKKGLSKNWIKERS